MERFLTRVRPHVHHQVAAAGEALPADFTDKRPLARVAARVILQLIAVPAAFAAGLADVALDVCLQVFQQVLSIRNWLAAHTAQEVVVVGVGLYMIYQEATVAECPPTNFTRSAVGTSVYVLIGSMRREVHLRSVRGSARQDVLVHLNILHLKVVGEVFGVLLHLHLKILSLNLRTGPHLLLLLFDGRRLQLFLVRLLLEIEAFKLLNICR